MFLFVIGAIQIRDDDDDDDDDDDIFHPSTSRFAERGRWKTQH